MNGGAKDRVTGLAPRHWILAALALHAAAAEKPEPPVQLGALPEAATRLGGTAIETQAAPAAAPVEAAGTGASGATRFDDAGDGDTALGGELEGLENDYGATLTAWIQRFHKFPRRLERRKIYGTAIVSFTIDRAGNLPN